MVQILIGLKVMTQNANKFFNKKFGIRINYAHLIDKFKSYYNGIGLRKASCFLVKKQSNHPSIVEAVTKRQRYLQLLYCSVFV